MAIYSYYLIIHKEDRAYIVSFPDMEYCYADAETLSGAVDMAEDVLALMLSDFEDDGDKIPQASPAQIKLPEGASLILVEVNTDNLREAV